jgi:sulfur carrier protein
LPQRLLTVMRIELNGQPREIADGTTIATLLRELEVAQPHVAVEVNLELVPRARHAETLLRPGDRLEVVTLVGGG